MKRCTSCENILAESMFSSKQSKCKPCRAAFCRESYKNRGNTAEGKLCSRCGVFKSFNHFYADPRHSSGLQSACKLCQKKYIKKHKRDNPEKYLWKSARTSAKQRGIEFTISEEDIIIPSVCPVLGLPLTPLSGPRSDTTPSIDRIDNNKGYTADNIHVISWRANNLKRDASLSELIKLVEYFSKK